MSDNNDPGIQQQFRGTKLPLKPMHIWGMRARLQVERRWRDLALLDVALDSKLRGCDLVALRMSDVWPVAQSGGEQSSSSKRRGGRFSSRSLIKRANQFTMVRATPSRTGRLAVPQPNESDAASLRSPVCPPREAMGEAD